LITKLYDGEIELAFEGKKHTYSVDGVPVPNVTTVLDTLAKPALIGWAAKETALYWEGLITPGESFQFDEVEIADHVKASKVARFKKSGKAKLVGAIVHDYAEQVAKDQAPTMPINKQAQRGCEAFNKWWGGRDIEVIAAERRIFSREHWYCGTADLLARINGELSVLDWKTSTGIYDEMKVQVGGAYRVALEEELGEKITGAWVVRFDKETGEPDGYQMNTDEMNAAWEAFRGALTTHVGLLDLKKQTKLAKAAKKAA
jgi:hypothetical protein